MPTVLRIDGFRFFFYSRENGEPPHVHVERGEGMAKYWLLPVALDSSKGFDHRTLVRVRRMVEANQHALMRSWNAFFRL